MSGITSSSGLFSGLDTQSLINQLLAVESRPRILFERRILQLQTQQTGLLDLNSRVDALKQAAAAFRVDKTFDAKRATSSDDTVLSGSASIGAQPGSYQFIVDRLVSTQQQLTRGFADRDSSAIGADSFSFESAKGRLDRDISLADLNGGSGIQRGVITITQGSNSAEIDLSRASTVQEVLDAINSASGIDVTARVSGAGLELTGSAAFAVSDEAGSTTAADLGILGASADVSGTQTLAGDSVYRLTDATALGTLNDGNGVFVSSVIGQSRYDFTITVGATAVQVNIGPEYDTDLSVLEGAPSTLGGLIDRINTELSDAGVTDVVARINDDGDGLMLENSGPEAITVAENTGSTAKDLGLLGSAAAGASIDGRRLLADLNGTLLRNINGGSGLDGTSTIDFTARDGATFSIDVSGAETVNQLIDQINADAGNAGRVVASLNDAGNGLTLTDTTGATASNLIVAGDAADALGLAGDVAATSIRGTNLQHAYITNATLLSDLNDGAGIGTGEIRITDGNGVITTIDIGSDAVSVFGLLREINTQLGVQGSTAEVAINDSGDGLIVREKDGSPDGASALKVEDVTGSVARNLNIRGEASGTGDDNFIDGSFETVVEFEPDDTLDEIVRKINESGGPATVSIINDGNGASPFRLSFISRESGRDGRYIFDSRGFDLGLQTLDRGEDARVFFGSSDPAEALLLTSSSNTLDSIVTGVSIDLKSASDDPVSLTVTRNTEEIEADVDAFIKAYNTLIDRIDFQTRYIADTEERGALLGDQTALTLRQRVFNTIRGQGQGIEGQYKTLFDIGVTVIEGGKLSLDKDEFRQALEADFGAVEELLAARDQVQPDEFQDVAPGVKVKVVDPDAEFSKLGIAGLIEELAITYTDSIDGVLTLRKTAIEDQIDLQRQRIESFNVILESKRSRLEAQFLAMERVIGQLQGQQGALASLAGAG
ncbi:MAG: flagellar filament capping protein FliD [Phycisphaerales bacterium JB037]